MRVLLEEIRWKMRPSRAGLIRLPVRLRTGKKIHVKSQPRNNYLFIEMEDSSTTDVERVINMVKTG